MAAVEREREGGPECDGDGAALTPEQQELWRQFVGGGWVLYRAFFREIDRSSALSSADWRLLEVLAAVPQLRISDLAEATQIGLSTVSRQVTRFLREGYVIRVEGDGFDQRQKWVQITEDGLAAVAPILQARDRAVRSLIIDRLTAEQFEQLCTMFGDIGARIAADEA